MKPDPVQGGGGLASEARLFRFQVESAWYAALRSAFLEVLGEAQAALAAGAKAAASGTVGGIAGDAAEGTSASGTSETADGRTIPDCARAVTPAGVHATAGIEDAGSTAAGRSPAQPKVHFCLSGGSTPLPLYRRLAADRELGLLTAGLEPVFWVGDERAVPPDDPDSNGRAIAEAFADCVWPVRLRIMLWPEAPDGSVTAREKACLAYAGRLCAELGSAPAFDLVLLGLGEDGHTAGLFPAQPDPCLDRRLAFPTEAPSHPKMRMSLGARAFLASKRRIFLVKGAGKAAILGRVLAGDRSLPATYLAGGASILYLE
jgi:6-phosphogluconolactonase